MDEASLPFSVLKSAIPSRYEKKDMKIQNQRESINTEILWIN